MQFCVPQAVSLLRRGDSEVMLDRVEAAAKTKLRMSGRELLR